MKIFKGWVVPVFVMVCVGFILGSFGLMRERAIERHEEEMVGDFIFEMALMNRVLHYDLLVELDDDFSVMDIFQLRRRLTGDDYADREARWAYDWWDEWHYIRDSFDDLDSDERRVALEVLSEELALDVIDGSREILSMFKTSAGISYLAYDVSSGVVVGDFSDEILEIVSDDVDEDLFDRLVSAYSEVVIFRFNNRGNLNRPLFLNQHNVDDVRTHMFHSDVVVDFIRVLEINAPDGHFETSFEEDELFVWEAPRDVIFVYGISNNESLVSDTLPIPYEDLWRIQWRFSNVLESYILNATFIVAVFALIVPLKFVRGSFIFEWISKMHIEIQFVLQLIFIWFVGINIHSISVAVIQSGSVLRILLLGRDNLWNIIWIVSWFVMFSGIAYVILNVRDMFSSGFGRSLRRRSFLVGTLYRFSKMDLKADGGWKLPLLVTVCPAVAYFAIVLVSSVLADVFFWRDHTAGVLLFSLCGLGVVFLVVRVMIVNIRRDYSRLFEITRQISGGEFGDLVDEDLGLFDKFKDELVGIRGGLKKAVDDAVASEKMKTDLISNVSHDLKTPLTSIITYVDLLKKENLSDEKRDSYLEILEMKSNRLKVLIEDLFEVSKATSGNIQMDFEEVDIVALMKQTLFELEDRVRDANLTVRENFPDGKVKLMLDGQRSHRVFENLILNMVKYSLPGTRAYIDIIQDESTVSITFKNISNHEINIDMDQLSERFVRGDASRNTEGTGLGLAIAKSFVQLQNGTFDVMVDGDLFKIVMIFKK